MRMCIFYAFCCASSSSAPSIMDILYQYYIYAKLSISYPLWNFKLFARCNEKNAEADCIAKRADLQRKQTAATPTPEPPKPLSIGKPSPWAAEACRRAVENGLFAGDGNGEYDWQQPLTREWLAAVLYKAKS